MFNSDDSTVHSSRTGSNFYTNYSGSLSYDCSRSHKNKEKQVKIPKRIMQTWIDHDIPDKWKSSPESIKRHMPDWDYVLMTDKDNRKLVKKHFPDFLPYYDNFTHNIQRCDAARYCYLYVYGGIYMDLDFEVLKPLDDMFINDNEVYLVNSSNIGSYLTNSFMASKPRCKLWLDCIEAMKKPLPFYCMGKHFEVLNSTGPIMLTNVVSEAKIVYGMLPVRLILPCSVCNIKCYSKGAYLKQLEGSSWVTYDTKFYNFFMCNYKQLLIAIALILFIILIALILQWCGIL